QIIQCILSRFLVCVTEATSKHLPFIVLNDGIFCPQLSHHSLVLQNPHVSQLAELLSCSFENLSRLKIPLNDRRFLLVKLVDFYRLHIDNMGEIRSHEVLQTLME